MGAQGDSGSISMSFEPPLGQELRAGTTYRVHATEATATRGRVWVHQGRDLMCGQREEDWGWSPTGASPAAGTVRVHELLRDRAGEVTGISLDYDLACQVVGDETGLAGSVAVRAERPAGPLPERTTLPGAVLGLSAANAFPNHRYFNTTTLTWRKPAGAADVVIDFVPSASRERFHPVIGREETWHVRSGSTWADDGVDFMDTRTYRVTARDATGRLGPPTYVTVLGTYVAPDSDTLRSTVGERVRISGRLTESFEAGHFSERLNGPAVPGQPVRLCRQPTIDFDYRTCATVSSTTTDAAGRFAFSVVPEGNTLYSVSVPASAGVVGSISRVINARVAPFTDLRLEGSTSARGATRLTASRSRAGASGTVQLQRLTAGRWKPVATKRLGTGRGRIAFPLKGRAPVQQYRVVKPGDRRHVAGVSAVVRTPRR